MKKNFIVKVMTLVMAATMVLTPVTASAAEKNVVTKAEFNEFYDDACLASFGYDVKASKENAELREQWLSNVDAYWLGDASALKANKKYLKLVESMDGSYQENGYKIYTVLNGATKTFKKTGKYSIVVGGKSAKKDEGTVKFVAPKTGTYKFTFSVKENVAGGRVVIGDHNVNINHPVVAKVNYKNGKGYVTNGKSTLILLASKGCAYLPKTGSLGDYAVKEVTSEMRTITGSVKLKKGQSVVLTARSSSADYNEDSECAYNFVGYDLKITKTK